MLAENLNVVARPRDNEDHGARPRVVAELEGDPPGECLEIAEPRLVLSERRVVIVHDDAVPGPEVAMARQRRLSAQTNRGRYECLEPLREAQGRSIADRAAERKELDGDR